MKKSKDQIKQWVDDLAIPFANETYRLIEAQSAHTGKEGMKLILHSYVSHFMENCVFDSLRKKQSYDEVALSFATIKHLLQDSIAEGFMAAMSKFSRQPIHYYCQITPVPESANKLMC